jgi:MYXO-CTERM domain-containing protein
VLALSVCALAGADLTTTQTFSYPSPYVSGSSYTDTGYPYDFSVAPFDPSLGTLNQVILTYAAQWEGSFYFVNLVPGMDTEGEQDLTFTLSENGNTLEDLSATSGVYDFGATGGEYTPTDNWSGSTSGTTDITTNLSDWQSGTVTVADTFYGTASLLLPFDLGTQAPGGATEDSGVDFGVQYEYTPEEGASTPEPSTLALGLMALGLGAGRLRRKKKS